MGEHVWDGIDPRRSLPALMCSPQTHKGAKRETDFWLRTKQIRPSPGWDLFITLLVGTFWSGGHSCGLTGELFLMVLGPPPGGSSVIFLFPQNKIEDIRSDQEEAAEKAIRTHFQMEQIVYCQDQAYRGALQKIREEEAKEEKQKKVFQSSETTAMAEILQHLNAYCQVRMLMSQTPGAESFPSESPPSGVMGCQVELCVAPGSSSTSARQRCCGLRGPHFRPGLVHGSRPVPSSL